MKIFPRIPLFAAALLLVAPGFAYPTEDEMEVENRLITDSKCAEKIEEAVQNEKNQALEKHQELEEKLNAALEQVKTLEDENIRKTNIMEKIEGLEKQINEITKALDILLGMTSDKNENSQQINTLLQEKAELLQKIKELEAGEENCDNVVKELQKENNEAREKQLTLKAERDAALKEVNLLEAQNIKAQEALIEQISTIQALEMQQQEYLQQLEALKDEKEAALNEQQNKIKEALENQKAEYEETLKEQRDEMKKALEEQKAEAEEELKKQKAEAEEALKQQKAESDAALEKLKSELGAGEGQVGKVPSLPIIRFRISDFFFS